MVVPYIAGDVLELGCGLAPVKGLADEKISHYCGIDSDPLVLDQARREHPNSAFFCRNIEKDSLGFEQEFDVVLMVALIEHIFNQGHLFEQAVQALKPGGRIVVTTPTPFGNDIVHRFGAAIGLFSKLAAAQHIVIYDKRRFKIAAQQFGLQLESHALFQLGCNQLAVLRKNG